MSTTGVAAEDSSASTSALAPPSSPATVEPGARRISGIDIACALAIVGMVMAHIGPIRASGGGVLGELYRIPHGRASILFVVVAGIGVSLLANGRAWGGASGVVGRLVWRVLLLLPLGLALQELGTGVAVILQYYPLFFLITIMAVRLPARALLGLAGVMSVVGPLAVLLARRSQPEWFGPIPEWSAFERVARDLAISGTYPALVWIVPLLIGLWVGRQDMRSLLVSARLLLGGAALAAGAFGVQYWLEGVAGVASSRTDWLQLAAIEPHNKMPLWVLSSTGIAVAIVGGATLLARAGPRLVWPLAAMGQLALSVYVIHLLILWQRPDWLRRGAFPEAWELVGVFFVVTLVLASSWRVFLPRGPLEMLFRLPWWVSRRRPRPPVQAPAGPGEVPETAPSSV